MFKHRLGPLFYCTAKARNFPIKLALWLIRNSLDIVNNGPDQNALTLRILETN